MTSALVWFRRDLRAVDHAALQCALERHERVYGAFVFDTDILDALPDRADRRVEFIRQSVVELDAALDALARGAGGGGSGLIVRLGAAVDVVPALAAALDVKAVYANRDYEPAAIARDRRVAERLAATGVAFEDCKDQVIFERGELLTAAGTPYAVFTPYRNAWRRRLDSASVAEHAVEPLAARLAPRRAGDAIPTLAELGFLPTNLRELGLPPGTSGARAMLGDFAARIDAYRATRDFPALKGPSYLSVHLRFGTVSIRELVALAWSRGGAGADAWLDELIWREFYQMLLWHHPHVVAASFRPECDRIAWDDAPERFAAWREGRTGYPIIDAGMRQLERSGYMHNRLRMLTASFLTKDLGIDWRRGERLFAERLNDYDLASNNGGWQWAASTGCDAQPYFRIFNPVTQSRRFDPDGAFIRRYVPELAAVPTAFIHAPWQLGAAGEAAAKLRIGRDYPAPIVDHAAARERTLERFAAARATR